VGYRNKFGSDFHFGIAFFNLNLIEIATIIF